jgi:hypothetical protein
MPAYDATNFRPPAPVALVTLRSPANGTIVSNVPMLLDTGADVSLVPRRAISDAASASTTDVQYELEAFDGTRTVSTAVELEMQFLGKSFRGQFLLVDGDYGIIGRNILNNLSLHLDGPAQNWTEVP